MVYYPYEVDMEATPEEMQRAIEDDEKRKQQIIEEIKSKFNDICLVYDSDQGRLIGFHEDEDDYYYVIKKYNGKIVLYSCCGHCTSLKGNYPRYDYIEETFERNGGTKELVMRISKDEEDTDCRWCEGTGKIERKKQ